MALTIHQTPDNYTPSDNPIIWTFSSDETTEPNFYYMVKVYINDVLIGNDPVYPTNGIYAYYDASWIASVNCQPPVISSDILADASNYCKVRITIVERYGVVVADGASINASNITAWKARMLDDDFMSWDSTGYVYGSLAKFLNNYPSTPMVRETGEQIRLMFINNLNTVTNFKIELFDVDGNSIVDDVVSLTATSFRIIVANLSPAVIIAETSITSTDFETAHYMEVSRGVDLEIFRIDIDRSIVYPTYKRLHFLTQWGDIASWSFGLISRRSGSVESHGYRQGFGEWSGDQWVFDRSRGRDIDHAKTVTRQLKCVSDWLTEEQQNWMVLNLYGTPLVYEESGVNLIRRRVTNKTIEEKIQENDLLFLEEVTLDLSGYNSMTL